MNTNDITIRDRFWLWGMKVNSLQESNEYVASDFGTSTMTVEQAIQRTGVRNVIAAGNLPITKETLYAIPSARRIIFKSSLHERIDGKNKINYDKCLSCLMGAKELAAYDTRIEGFLVDDFSTGSIEAGVLPEHISRMQFANTAYRSHLPMGATIYTMSLDLVELHNLLPFFAYFLVPLWHADQISLLPSFLDRLSDLSGAKPMLLCLYVYDFGNNKPIPRVLMQSQLDMAEMLLHEERITGLAVCGTCMMDLDWQTNHCMYEWLDRVGDQVIEGKGHNNTK